MSVVEGVVTIVVPYGWDSTQTFESTVSYSLTWLITDLIAAVDVVRDTHDSGHEFATALVGKDGVRWIYSSGRTPMRGLPVPTHAAKIGESLRAVIFGASSEAKVES
jgi:hypothetical protein